MSEDMCRRIANLEHVLFGNGREGISDRLTRTETILYRIDKFMNQIRLIVIGQVLAFVVALVLALI